MANQSVLEIDEVGGYARIVKPARKAAAPDLNENTWKRSEQSRPADFRCNTLGRERPIASSAHRSSTMPRKPAAPPTLEPPPALPKKKQTDADEMNIATVRPYKREDSSSHNHFKIEDVTDDPKYKDYDSNSTGLEGALIEYCRLDSRQQPAGPHVFNDASTVLSARSVEQRAPSSNWKSRLGGGQLERTAHPANSMAHTIDVDVGGRCLKCGLNCRGFRAACVGERFASTANATARIMKPQTKKVLNVYERLGIKPKDERGMAAVAQGGNRGDAGGNVANGYSWVPPGLSRAKVEQYMASLPNHVVPRTNSVGEKYREKQLMLPRQDLSMAYCKHLKSAVERRIYEEFVNSRNEVALDIGYVCAELPATTECRKCKGTLPQGSMSVLAPKLGEDAAFHPACFFCGLFANGNGRRAKLSDTCQQLLVDLTYCVREDKIYCERHYAELHKPRCSACDEAMNKDWHTEHFGCWQCDTQLTGQRYILRDDHPFCIKCYEEVFANTCDECGKAIGIDSKVDQPFGSKNDKIFCSNCYDQTFATRCDGCNEIFRAGMKKMEYKGKCWHEKCFCCAMCKTPIGTKSFIPKNDEVYCSNCYEEKYATRCCKCKKVIASGGVTYKNEPWTPRWPANGSRARTRSRTARGVSAICSPNAAADHRHRRGEVHFVSDRHWHNDCFTCAQCTASLVGKGFITDGADILCPECAKARLMAQNA
ncbi:BMA-LIM-9, isoform c [Aphelenchoides fujianensis]|nr:BMA-LIM-9, isoform c [Aphelenchoides fujianensis]